MVRIRELYWMSSLLFVWVSTLHGAKIANVTELNFRKCCPEGQVWDIYIATVIYIHHINVVQL